MLRLEQKSVAYMEYLVQKFSKSSDLVSDVFARTLSTAKMC